MVTFHYFDGSVAEWNNSATGFLCPESKHLTTTRIHVKRSYLTNEYPLADKVAYGVEETLTYCDFLREHWMKIRTNNCLEQLNREICRRTRGLIVRNFAHTPICSR